MAGEGGLSFVVGVEDINPSGQPQTGAASPAPSAAASPALTAAEMKQLIKDFGKEGAQQILAQGEIHGVPLAQAMQPTGKAVSQQMTQQLEVIEQTLLPAEAQAAPKLAAEMRATAAAPSLPQETQRVESAVKAAEELPLPPAAEHAAASAGAVPELISTPFPEGTPPAGPGGPAGPPPGGPPPVGPGGLPSHLPLPVEVWGIKEEVLAALTEATAGAMYQGRTAAPTATVETAAAAATATPAAATPTMEAVPAEAEDEAMRTARARLEATKKSVAADRAYAQLTGQEEPVYDAIDPEVEERKKAFQPHQEYLHSGARVAAQAGLGTVGQALGGAADLGMGIATGNPMQAVAGGLELADAGAKALAATFDSFAHTVEFAGDELKDFAGNDYMGMFNHAVDFAADSLEKIPIAGQVLGAALEAAAAPVKMFAGVVEAFVERGKELSGYSGELAGANALADVRSQLSDIMEAQAIGEDLARLTDAQSQFTSELRELLLPIKEWLVGVLADAMETVIEWTHDAKAFFEFARMAIHDLVLLFTDLPKALAQIGKDFSPENLAKIWREAHAAKPEPDFTGLDANFWKQEMPVFGLPQRPAPNGMQVPMVPF